MNYTYTTDRGQKIECTDVSAEQVEKIAAAFVAAGIDSPYSSDFNAPRKADKSLHESWELVPAIVEQVDGLNKDWRLGVSHVLGLRQRQIRQERLRSEFESIAHAGIRAHLLALPMEGSELHRLRLEVRDLSDLTALAMRPRDTNQNRGYEPAPGCTSKLKLKAAIHFHYEQAAYADYAQYAVPVEVAADADPQICQQNLNRFTAALCTHNGFAGSGSTWTATLKLAEGFVLLTCRASISD